MRPKRAVFVINSPGGWVLPGVAIYDTIQFVRPDVHTVCIGLAASMGSFILVGGEITKRRAFPHAWVMMHQPGTGYYRAQVGEFILEAAELLKLRETLTGFMYKNRQTLMGLYPKIWKRCFMSATEAQAYGIVDLVAVQ
ncbi:hypothetical protein HAX54_046578 [Datura stramonium]|uniref:ATP-dependent Clp protease proteolytic subunit n=1 Tax=Datura stramonium TaxID=4076 RepID=A0ABS8SRM7_DATST|nr:hypothetical protein [Datura stramonium]